MGCIETITAYKFPKQSEYVNRRCNVCFHYDTSVEIPGTIIRDDREEPYETLIQLDDGRVVRGVECQYSLALEAKRNSKGKWKQTYGDESNTRTCSVCHISQTVNVYQGKVMFNYCPYCGADMR